jgi:hypothetical protein
VDIVLHGLIEADDGALPAVTEAMRVLRPGGRLIVIGYCRATTWLSSWSLRWSPMPAARPGVDPAGGCATDSRSRWSMRAWICVTTRRRTPSCPAYTATAQSPF